MSTNNTDNHYCPLCGQDVTRCLTGEAKDEMMAWVRTQREKLAAIDAEPDMPTAEESVDFFETYSEKYDNLGYLKEPCPVCGERQIDMHGDCQNCLTSEAERQDKELLQHAINRNIEKAQELVSSVSPLRGGRH